MIQPYNRILLELKEEISIHMKIHGKPEIYIDNWKMSVWYSCILTDSNYMSIWKRQKDSESKKISGS